MIKYRGQFRVVLEVDKQTGNPGEFYFIPCICRHDENTLNVYVPGIKTVNRLLKEYPNIFTAFQTGDREATFLFSEANMGVVAAVLMPYTKGKAISPRFKTKNLRFAG